MQSIQIAMSEIWVSLILLGVLMFFNEDMRKKKVTRVLLWMCIIRLVSDAISWGFDCVPGTFWGVVTRISNYITLTSNDLVLTVFSIYVWHLVRRDGEKPSWMLRLYWGCEVVSVVALTLNTQFEWFYSIDENNVYSRGEHYQLTYIAPVFALLIVFWMLLKYRKRLDRNQTIMGWIYFLLMSSAMIYDFAKFGLPLRSYAQTFSAILAFFVGEIEIRKNLEKVQNDLAKTNEELKSAKMAAEAANIAKSKFLFNMSHDIRTPMNAIIGFSTLLEKHQDDPVKRQDYIEKISNSSDVLLSIINNVLEMSRIESGAVEVVEGIWCWEQFKGGIHTVFDELMQEKNIEFSTELNLEHSCVYCDKNKIRDIGMNLLSNAYKYTNPGGSVKVMISEFPSEKEGYAIYQMKVADTGMGMEADFIPHIFEEFSREDDIVGSNIIGTGLGMPIVKRLVDLLHATIDVKSKKGEGTTFTVTFELCIAENDESLTVDSEELNSVVFAGKRVLLAEDNDLNAQIAIEILLEVGLEIHRAKDGQECCDMLLAAEDGYYSLILMDIQMPVMNGYDATRTIRRMSNQAKASIPILAMTANAFEEDKRDAYACGMDGHISKPIVVKDLMNNLSKIMG